MDSFDGSFLDQWHGTSPHLFGYVGMEQNDNSSFDRFEFTELPDFDEFVAMDPDAALPATDPENTDRSLGFQEQETTWKSEVALRPAASTFHHHTLALLQSPAAATNTGEVTQGTSIASSSSNSWRGSGCQTVFRAVQDAPRGSVQHPAAVWESHKAEIRQLYMDQQKTLREVMDVLAQKGFHATTRMYKNRLSQWGFVKNTKRATGGSSRQKVNRSGNPPKRDVLSLKLKATRERQAQLVTPEELLAAGIQVFEDGKYLRWLTSPYALDFQNGFLGSLRDLLRRYYTLDRSFNRGIAPFISHITSHSRQSVNSLIQSVWFFNQKQHEHGVKFAKTTFDAVLDFLQDQNFYSLLYLFISIPQFKDSRLLCKLLECLNKNARVILGPNHRLSLLFKLMYEFYDGHGPIEFTSIISDSMKGVFDILDDMENEDDYCTTWLKCDYAWIAKLDEKWVKKLLNEVITIRDSLDKDLSSENYKAWVNCLYLQLQVVRSLEGDESDVTFQVAEEVRNRLSLLDHEVQALCFRTMSRYHRKRCTMENLASDARHIMARYCIRRATEFDEAHWGLGKQLVIKDLERLRDWSKEAKCSEEVEKAEIKLAQGMQLMPDESV